MKNFVMTDLHGMLNAYEAAFKYMNSLNTEYKIFFLGDAIDRGEDSYTIMKLLLDDPNVVYLKGNHEDMFVQAARDILDSGIQSKYLHDYRNSEAVQLSLHNGGAFTLQAWINDGMPQELIDRIDNLPITFSIGNYDLCHAGCSIRDFKDEDEFSILWNRHHFKYKWPKDRILIHGHTPVQYMDYPVDIENYKLGPMRYNNNKIDMDTGVFFSGIFYLYDMDNDQMIKIL